MSKNKGVAIITNIMAPYRIPLFNDLSAALNGALKAFFCAQTYDHRKWSIPESVHFNYEILSGLDFRREGKGYYERRFLHFTPEILPKLIKMRPTAVISAEFSVPSMLALVYCRLFGASFISWSENTLQQEQHASNMQRRVRRLLIKNASACVGTSSGARDKYIHYGCQPEAAFVAIQTVDVSFFMRGAERMRQEQNQDAPATILYTGALSERKGVRYLIQAFAQLAKSHPCRLVLVGQGPLEQEFKQQVSRWGLQEQVHFSGFLEGDALVQRYAEATLFVLPTLEDTFGLVVNEAMACQLPIICSPFAGAAQDLVREGENGYIVDPQQQAALVQRMEEIITDPALQKQMGRASREIIGEYGMETAVQGFIQAIHYATGEKE